MRLLIPADLIPSATFPIASNENATPLLRHSESNINIPLKQKTPELMRVQLGIYGNRCRARRPRRAEQTKISENG